ncbi:MAG: hypothetical protein SD837_02305 [Candidatus Electrothrix scaldis]|nr:MAG: hypothetical protein SD837_02305 [Candidatus Electrothrix sp. GW3-3]
MFEQLARRFFNNSKQNGGKTMQKIILIMMIILSPVQGYALEFDIWRTGQAKKKVQEKAKKNKIELRKNATAANSKKGNANQIDYNDSLFQEDATVSLVFTQKTGLLYGIIIDWRNIENVDRGEALYEKVSKTLGKKYIQDEKSEGRGMIKNKLDTFNDCATITTKYKGGISSMLFRCQEKRFITVRYIDSKLERQNAFEEQGMMRTRDKDSEKF